MALVAKESIFVTQEGYIGNLWQKPREPHIHTGSIEHIMPEFQSKPSNAGGRFTNSTVNNLSLNNNNRVYVSARASIINQYNELSEYYTDKPKNRILSKALKTLNKILEYNPDVISYELTYEYSIIFTFKIEDYTFFFQQYFVHDFGDEDEALLSSYKGNDKLPSFAGSLELALSKVSSHFNHLHPLLIEEEVFYELSF